MCVCACIIIQFVICIFYITLVGCMCVIVDYYFNPKEEEKRTRREIQYSRTFEMFS